MIPLTIASGMIVCWMFGVLHPALIGFIGCFLFRAIGGVEFEEAFAGFGTELPWFFYGVLLLSLAADRSGVIAAVRAASPRALRGSIVIAALVLAAMAYALAFVVPSSLARATMLMIVAAALGTVCLAGGDGGLRRRSFRSSRDARRRASDRRMGSRLGGGHRRGSDDGGKPLAGVTGGANAGRRVSGHGGPGCRSRRIVADDPLHGLSPALVGLGCGLVCLLPGFAPPGKHVLEVNHLAVIVVGTAITIPMVLEASSKTAGQRDPFRPSWGSPGASTRRLRSAG